MPILGAKPRLTAQSGDEDEEGDGGLRYAYRRDARAEASSSERRAWTDYRDVPTEQQEQLASVQAMDMLTVDKAERNIEQFARMSLERYPNQANTKDLLSALVGSGILLIVAFANKSAATL